MIDIIIDFFCRFKERSLIKKLKPIHDASCGVILFEVTLMDSGESRVILNYMIKFQIRSNNGHAAKKRRVQEMEGGVCIILI